MKHGSLFSGLGGFDLAAEWMGWENVFHCEIDKFCQTILKYYWPKSILYENIKTTDFTIWRGQIDILTGGFPCQPFSTAGKRKGTDDNRFLWPEMFRAIREIQPQFIIAENVSGLLTQQNGMVFEQVCSEMETEGYEVQPFIIPACGVNAPHKRERVWIIAYSNSNGYELRKFRKNRPEENKGKGFKEKRKRVWENNRRNGNKKSITNSSNAGIETMRSGRENTVHESGITPNPNKLNGDLSGLRASEISQQQKTKILRDTFTNTGCSKWQNGLHGNKQGRKTTEFGNSYTKFGNWKNFPITEPQICSRNDGISGKLYGITFPKWRNESIKAFGNAVVPQVVYEIFKAIQIIDNEKQKNQ